VTHRSLDDRPDRSRDGSARPRPDAMRPKRPFVSVALLEEARGREDLRVVSEPEPFEFEDGALPTFP
jgi:hypothetical protein